MNNKPISHPSDAASRPRHDGAHVAGCNGDKPAKPIVIVSVISNLEFGGAQRQLVEFANHVDTTRFRHALISLSSYVPLANDLKDRSQLQVVNKSWKFDVTVVPRLARLLRDFEADVVHGYLFDAEIAARLAGAMARTPLIVGAERNTEYHIKRRQFLVYAMTRRLMHICIANSHAGADFNRRMLKHDANQYRVVHNCVDSVRFAPGSMAAARELLRMPEGEYSIGMIASFKYQKNHGMLLRALRKVLDAGVACRAYLVGDELYAGLGNTREYKDEMLATIERLGLKEHCVFLGNRGDLEAVYPAFDVTVLPSRFEGTPNSVLESMACGVPVVVTDVSDNRLLVPDGEVGFVVGLNDDDALAERLTVLARDVPLRRRLGIGARQRVLQEYTPARFARRVEQVYVDALIERGTLPTAMKPSPGGTGRSAAA